MLFIRLQLGGVIAPNDGHCHMSVNGDYTHSSILDYPSISQINLKVKENAINVIFAVTSSQLSVYEKLSKHIEGSSSAALSEDSSNVVDLVKEQYSVSIILLLVKQSEKRNYRSICIEFTENFLFR